MRELVRSTSAETYSSRAMSDPSSIYTCLALHLIDRTDELDAAALAPSAGMDLRLHDHDRVARILGKLARRLGGFLDREGGLAAGNGRAE